MCSVKHRVAEAGHSTEFDGDSVDLSPLGEAQETELIKQLARYPDVVARAAESTEPQQIANYLRDLAGEFHAYYNAHKVMVDDASLRTARLALSEAVRQVLANGLDLLGVSAPESM